MRLKIILTALLAFVSMALTAELFAQKIYDTKTLVTGDSTLSSATSGYEDVYVELADSSDSFTDDTLLVYIETPDGSKTLAWLTKDNDSSSILVRPVQSNGVIISGDGKTSFWKINYKYPYKVFVKRTNVTNLARRSYVGIKAIRKPGEVQLH